MSTTTTPAPVDLGPRRYRTGRELKIIREHYPDGGAAACRALLPHLSIEQIYRAALVQGVRLRHALPKRRYPPDERLDEAIRRLYLSSPARGEVSRFARSIGRPRSWVGSRAAALGVVRPRTAPLPWSAEEDALLEATAHLHPKSVATKLKALGASRSETAIVMRRKRLGMRAEGDPDRYSSRALGRVMGIDAKKVVRWITTGRLKAKRAGTARTEAQGGDEWEIHRRDVRAFLISHLGDWDHRRCDQLWLVEILAGAIGGPRDE